MNVKEQRKKRSEAVKAFRTAIEKVPPERLDNVVSYVHGYNAGVDLAKKNERT